jgi:hypothetical protein
MLRPEGLLFDSQCPLIEALCLREFTLNRVEIRQVVEGRGYLGMVRPEGLLSNPQCPQMERLCLRIFALDVVEAVSKAFENRKGTGQL